MIDITAAEMATVNVSPAVYAFAVIVPDPLNVPAVDAFHTLKCVASSEPAMLVH